MIRKSFLEKLLNGAGVEWTALGDERYVEVANAARRPIKASLRVAGTTPYYGANNVQDYVEGFTHDGEYALIAEDGSADLRNYSIQYASGKFWANNHVHVVRGRSGLNTKFVYHYLRNVNFAPYLPNKDRSKLTRGELIKIPLPIPCPEDPRKSLAIQGALVQLLDGLDELTAELATELSAELAARKKQYNHYRDQLLRFEGGEAEWKALGDIGEFIRGKRFTKADFVDDGIDAIHYGEIYTRYGVWTDHAVTKVRSDLQGSLRYAKPNDVVLTGVGETVEDVGKAVAWIGSGNVAIHDDSYAFRHSMNPKYIAYAMQTASFIDEKAKHVSRGKVNRLLIDGVAKVRVPIPFPNNAEKSLAEQARIVAILDKFDALTHSITEGLPREIELRQKQYDYYRDLLLSFPKPHEAAA